MEDKLSGDEVSYFEDLARKFSKKSILPMFEGEFPDGDLDKLPDIIKTAFEIGIAASPDRSMAGSEYGIWGSATHSSGLLPSITLLSAIAETCGGVAMGFHAQGLATNLLLKAKNELPVSPINVALCLQEEFGLPYCKTLFKPNSDSPARISTQATPENGGYVLNGLKPFVYSLKEVDAYVVPARVDDKWACFVIASDAQGVKKMDVGLRTGLRACTVNHIELTNARVQGNARIDEGDALGLVMQAMCLNWVGLTAIAVGISKGAVASAKKYASERYQGGTIIENQPAVKMLIGDSDARSRTAESAVIRVSHLDPTRKGGLRSAAMAKLTGLELCARAVTDSLQCFGGYGYMEDYGMEKRLRDVAVLKSASGSPNYLKQLVFDMDKEGDIS